MPLSSSYLKIGHSRFYDLPAWAVYYVPDLFGVCQLFSFYGLVAIYASSSRLYCLLSRISAHHFFCFFFSCVVLFASRNVLLFHDFRLLLLLSVRAIWGESSKLYHILCDGVPGSVWLVAPLFLLIISFFQFLFKAITWGVCALPSW